MGQVASFTLQLLHPHGKRPQQWLNRRLDGHQSQSEPFGEEINLFPLWEAHTPVTSQHILAIPAKMLL